VLVELDTEAGVITATEDHPFWNATDRAWQRADELDPGDVLLGPDGSTLRVEGIVADSARVGDAHNLTVEQLHTYFVVVNDAPVLVHNTCSINPGPGSWGPVSESMSDRAAAYQQQITGVSPNTGYVVDGVKFDGFADGVLQDAKGPGYSQFVKNGEFRDWFDGADALVNQANRQLAAAGDTPIQWSVAEADAVTAINNLFAESGIAGIDVVHVPAN
jgi:hypothetical protein